MTAPQKLPEPVQSVELSGDNPAKALRDLGYMTEEEIAQLADVKLVTLRNWRWADTGPPYVYLNGKTVIYHLGGFLKWLEGRTVRPAKTPTLINARPRRRRQSR
jgi:hypothetical protein